MSRGGIILSKTQLALGDDWQLFFGGQIEKVDVQVYNGDALIAFASDGYTFEPAEGIRLQGGSFTSITALGQAFGGPTALRIKRAAPGVQSMVDLTAWAA